VEGGFEGIAYPMHAPLLTTRNYGTGKVGRGLQKIMSDFLHILVIFAQALDIKLKHLALLILLVLRITKSLDTRRFFTFDNDVNVNVDVNR
jgi:hypothetical protein